MYSIELNLSGPIFDGTHHDRVKDFIDDAKFEVGQQALAEVHHILDQRIKHPTPYYETQVIMQGLGSDVVVHDRDLIYGPWLEGTSERNRTTRFKGYAAFRTAAQAVERQIDTLVRRVLTLHIGRF